MTGPDRTFPRLLTRRALLAMLAVAAAGPAVAAEHPAVDFMKLAAKDLLHANRQGTLASFKRALQRHAAIPDIALYSLGQYKAKLPEDQRSRYYGGVVTFMARYFADQSREYRVAKYELGSAFPNGDEVQVTSKVFLLSGQTYTVTWQVAKREGKYKIIDVKVLGFSLVYLQRNLFTAFLSKRNGDVTQLVGALIQ